MSDLFSAPYFSIMGDSISALEGTLPYGYEPYYNRERQYVTGVHGSADMWWGQVIRHFGGRLLVNNSWSGSYVCCPPGCIIPSYGCSDERSGGLGEAGISPDHILVYIGSNDRGAGLRLTADDPDDLTVIENAYALMLDKIKRNYPNAQIWCCTFVRTTCSSRPEFVFPLTHRGLATSAYSRRVAEIALEKGCHVVDLANTEELCDTVDCLHPNYAGMTVIAREVIRTMEAAGMAKREGRAL